MASRRVEERRIAFQRYKEDVKREGKPFYSALETSAVFTDMSIDMVKVGEATGSLDEMLTEIADFYQQDVEYELK